LFCASLASEAIDVEEAKKAAQKKIAELKSNAPHDFSSLSEVEVADSREQLDRLRLLFGRIAAGASIEISPMFPGSGIINSCEGDLFFGETLFEIKAGQRTFRTVDIKQLLTYAALNYASGLRKLNRVGLFNPRMGISFCATLDEVSLETSGCMAGELLPEIVRVISSGDVSRKQIATSKRGAFGPPFCCDGCRSHGKDALRAFAGDDL